MTTGGVRRKVDDLGRVVIPASIRHALGLDPGAEVDITVEADRCVLRRVASTCSFCGSEQHLEDFRDQLVCWSCMAAIRALDRERLGVPADPFG